MANNTSYWEISERGSTRMGIIATLEEVAAILRWYLYKEIDVIAEKIDLNTGKCLYETWYIRESHFVAH